MPFRLLIEEAPVAMGLITLSGRILHLNPAVRRIYGARVARARTVEEFIRAGSRDARMRARALAYWRDEVLAAARARRAPAPFLAEMEGVGGKRDVIFRAVRKDDLVVAILEDITEVKRGEDALRQSEERLSQALRGAQDGLWDWNLLTDEVYYSPRWKEMLGYGENEVEHHLSGWNRLVHPEDRARVLQLVSQYLAGLVTRFEAEFRMRHKAGHWVDVLARGTVVRDARRRARRMVGTHVDITARKEAEARLRAAHDELEQRVHERTAELEEARAQLELLVQTVPAGIVLHGRDGRILRVNDAALEMLGVSREEADTRGLEHPGWHFLHEDGRRMRPEEYLGAQVFATRKAVRDRIVGVQRDGTADTLWATVNVEPRLDAAGEVAELVVGFMDISARFAAERSRDEHRQLLQSIINSCEDMIFVKDRELRTVLCNTAFARAIGRRPEETYGRTDIENGWLPELVKGDPARNIRGFEADDRAALAGQTVRNLCDPANVGDEIHYFDTIKLPLRDRQGEIIGVLAVCRDITDQHRAETALRESEARHRLLIEGMMDAFVGVDMRGRIIHANSAFQSMLGYSEGELRQLTYHDVTPERWRATDDEILREQVLKRGYSDVFEKEYVRKDGTVLPVELRAFLLRDATGQPVGMWGIVRDISERKQVEAELRQLNQTLEERVAERTAALRESEARFRLLAESTFEGIAISVAGRVTDTNAQFAAMFGYEPAEVIDREILEFVIPESRPLVAANLRKNHVAPYEVTGLRKDGSTFPVEAHARMRTLRGRSVRVTAMRDLTPIREAGAELERQRAELARAQRLAELSEVSAGVIHQIGQPLTAIINNVSAARTMVSRCTSQQCQASAMLLDTDASLRLVQTTMSRLRALAHPERVHRELKDLNVLVVDILHRLQPEAKPLGIELKLNLAPDLPPASVDDVQFSQVLLNLVHNACDAVAPCEPARRRVTVATRRDGPGRLLIEVADAGGGIPPAVLPKLFEPFFTTKPNGTGVGLRLCRTIVTAHGGTLTARNNDPEPGATFQVSLPACLPGKA